MDFFYFGVGKEWREKKKLQKRGKVRESWEKEEGNEDIGGKRRERTWYDEKGSKRGGSVQMRKWREMRILAEKVRSGRCV